MSGFEERPQRIIADFGKLDFDYVPDVLVHRKEPMDRLFSIIWPGVQACNNQRAVITGSVGTGKSSVAKRFCMDFKDWAAGKGQRVEFAVVNCRSRNTPSSALLKILDRFQPGFPDRGFSTTEMLEILRKHLVRDSVHLIVVLDEVNALVKRSGPDLLYSLSRFDEERVSGSRHSVSLVLISQQPINEFLDAATLSTIKRTNHIFLDRYNRDELRDIVAQRVELAFYPGTVPEDTMDFIADIASEYGDARFAIELLENAGRIANEQDSEVVEPEHVRAAKAMTHPVVTESALAALGRQKQLVLLGAARALKRKAFATTGEVEEAYHLACEEYGEEPRGHTQFWTYLNELADGGLMGMRKSGKGQAGKTSIITLPDIPSGVLEEKLRDMLA